jgi:dTDP-4-amino-4,6-dideoxygalactose transaminase
MGVNSRLDEIQAAILSARLPCLARWTAARREVAGQYRRLLAGAPVDVPPECDNGHVYHLLPILSASRDRLQTWLHDLGVETLIHYPVPIPRQPALASERPGVCPVADRVCARILSLPLYPGIPESDVELVANAISRFTP